MKVRLENITKKYGQTVAVNNFSAELPDGHLICLLGPSGCGKSTILNMLCGIANVTQGHIFFDDKEVTKLPPDQRNIGMVFQNYALYPHMTVAENIAFPLEVKKMPKKERLAKAEEIAKLVHVETLLKRYPSELSGGQQQRVAIARALVKNPKLLLMDEPLSNLDARLRLEMREEIRRIQLETGVTTVFVTHDQEEAMSISDSILLMKDGNLIQAGLCQNLYNQPETLFVAEFLGNPPVNKICINFEEESNPDKRENKSAVEFENNPESGIQISELKMLLDEAGIKMPEDSDNKEMILCIRPEAFNDDGKIPAEVLSISEMGKEQIITLKLFNSTVRGILNSDKEIKAGDKIHLGLKKKGIFIFEKESGKRIV